ASNEPFPDNCSSSSNAHQNPFMQPLDRYSSLEKSRVFTALAEFIRELIVAGTRESLDAARRRVPRAAAAGLVSRPRGGETNM
ncbi:hypothetical protein ACWEPL_58825, partial [Nonomuraea sp. NPDC004186]